MCTQILNRNNTHSYININAYLNFGYVPWFVLWRKLVEQPSRTDDIGQPVSVRILRASAVRCVLMFVLFAEWRRF